MFTSIQSAIQLSADAVNDAYLKAANLAGAGHGGTHCKEQPNDSPIDRRNKGG